MDINTLVQQFTAKLVALIANEVAERASFIIAEAVGTGSVGGVRPGKTSTAAPVRRAPTTAKASRARKVQGQYLGALRSLKGADRARVKKAAKEEGVAAAVALAKKISRA